MKRYTFLFISLVVIVGFAFGAGSQDDTAQLAGEVEVTPRGQFPIAKGPATLDIFSTLYAWTWGEPGDFDDKWVLNWYEDLTGVNVNWTVAATDASEKVNLMLASQAALPDIFLHQFTPEQIATYGSQGLFQPMNDLIDEYGYGVARSLSFDPDVRNKVTAPDGNIYSLWHTFESSHGDYGQKMWINTAWLDRLGLEMPTTIQEYRRVLQAFRDEDANGNGDPNDEIPLSGSHSAGAFGSLDGFLMNAFIYSSGSNGDRLMQRNGTVVPVFTQDAYREGLRYLNGLWEDGLIDEEIFIQQPEQLRALTEHPDGSRVGSVPVMHFGVFSDLSKDTKLQYAPLMPLEGPAGVRQSPYYYPGVNLKFVITQDADNPDLAFRWGDGWYLHAATGDHFAGYWEFEGKEDVAWRRAEPDEVGLDGGEATWIRLPLAPEDQKYGGIVNAFPVHHTYEYKRGLVADPNTWQHERELLEATWDYENFGVDKTLPPLFLDAASSAELAELKTNINDFVEESIAKFVSGVSDLDDDWDRYLDTLNAMGLDRYIELIQQGYTRQWQ